MSTFTAYRCWDWEWNGTLWTKINNVNPHPPFGTARGSIVYDLARAKVVMENGSTNYPGNVPDRPGDPTDILGRVPPATMERNSITAWAQPTPTHPASLLFFDMGYDEANSQTVLVTYTNTTWTRGSGNWVLESPATPASGNVQFQDSPSKIVFDQNRGKLVALAYAGTGSGIDVKEWSGTNWASFTGTRPLGAADNYAFACGYDSTHGKVVYYNYFNGQTWTRSGTTWTQRFPTHSPASGSGNLAYMCDDPNLGGLVLLQNAFGPKLWLWNSDLDWTDITPPSQPVILYAPTQLVWDPNRHVVFGMGGIEAYEITEGGVYMTPRLLN